MSVRKLVVTLAVGCAVIGAASAEPPPGPLKRPAVFTNVKTRTDFRSTGTNVYCTGVVEKVSDSSATVRCVSRPGRKPWTVEVCPIDLLADGKIVEGIEGCSAYLWSDMKEGDSVRLDVLHDDGDGKNYCFAVCISRRPGAKLPQGQKPKEDGRYEKDSLLNDVVNGEDVSDDDIARLYPPYFASTDPRKPVTGPKELLDPGGLWGEYKEKLDATRAKKAKEKKDEPRAKPVEK